MYARVAPERKPDPYVGGKSPNLQKKTSTTEKQTKRLNVRSFDYRVIMQLILANPNLILPDEILLLQMHIGSNEALAFVKKAKQQKQLKKMGAAKESTRATPAQVKKQETIQQIIQKKSPGKVKHTNQQTEQVTNFQTKQDGAPAPKSRLPKVLRDMLEKLSGVSLSDVEVHRNSDKPQKVGALAYTQGNEIHIAPGQEEHLPHEGWHAVQQKQGRVQPTLQMKSGKAVNDDEHLEKEADVMSRKAEKESYNRQIQVKEKPQEVSNQHNDRVIQKKAHRNEQKVRLYEPISGAVAEVDAQKTQTIELLLSKGYKKSSTKGEKESWVLKVEHGNIKGDVIVFQKFLVSCGYLDMPISSSTNERVPFGTYGELTKQAVMKFQEKKGLKADGIVGADTWKAALLPWNKESNEPDRHNHQYLIILSNKNILHDEKKENKNAKGDINYLTNIKSNLYVLGYHNVYKDYKAARNLFLKEFHDKGHSLYVDFIRMGDGEHYSSLLSWTDRALAGKITRNKKETKGTGNASVSEEEVIFITKMKSVGMDYDNAYKLTTALRNKNGNLTEQQYRDFGFADNFGMAYVEIQYKLVREGMSVEAIDYSNTTQGISQAIAISVA